MTSPRGPYGGGYYTSSALFPDTPIYDSLVAERGTPQIAPIRVPSAYETGSNLPALPALPSGPSQAPPGGMPTGYLSAQPTGYQQASPATQYLPQQANLPARGAYQGAMQHPTPPPYQNGYDSGAMRQVAPRPVPPRQVPVRPMQRQAPGPYDDQYRRPPQGPAY